MLKYISSNQFTVYPTTLKAVEKRIYIDLKTNNKYLSFISYDRKEYFLQYKKIIEQIKKGHYSYSNFLKNIIPCNKFLFWNIIDDYYYILNEEQRKLQIIRDKKIWNQINRKNLPLNDNEINEKFELFNNTLKAYKLLQNLV